MKIFVCIMVLAIPVGLLAQSRDSSFQYVEVEGGLTIPVGAFKNTMDPAPSIGLWIRKPHAHNSVWAYGLSINFPKSTSFQYME